MSIEIMTAVWASSQAKGRALLLMLALADYADEKGMSYPSVSTLAKKSRMSERSVQVMLRILVDMGELAVELGGGAHRSSHYRILAQKGAGSAPVQGLRGAEIDQKGADLGRKRVQTSAPDPSLDPLEDPSVAAARARAPEEKPPGDGHATLEIFTFLSTPADYDSARIVAESFSVDAINTAILAVRKRKRGGRIYISEVWRELEPEDGQKDQRRGTRSVVVSDGSDWEKVASGELRYG